MEENSRKELEIEIIDEGVATAAPDGPGTESSFCCWGPFGALFW